MKKFYLYGYILFIASCSTEKDIHKTLPVKANYTFDKEYAIQGEEVLFRNTSENASHYRWNFGDGNYSLNKNVSHVFFQPGNFTVELIASNEVHSDSICKNINIYSLEDKYWPDDNWKKVSPASVGMKAENIELMDEYIQKELNHIRSVIVLRNGYIVFEKYYRGLPQDDNDYIASATKTFTAILMGIAIDKGYISNIHQSLTSFFPDCSYSDNRMNDITLYHLLTMSPGLQWSDNADFWAAINSSNPAQYFFSKTFIAEPGSEFKYNSMCSHLLNIILKDKANQSVIDFANGNLFKPLGIEDVQWDNYNGVENGATLLYLQARDMAKFGYMLLNRGKWKNNQIVSDNWIDQLSTVQNEGGAPHKAQYGYQTWITNYMDYKVYFAGGYGGQFILVIPDLNIVTVIKSDKDRHHEENRDIVRDYIIPSVIK
jgi:CubicO group peptidase (beta-lactamase class C family)